MTSALTSSKYIRSQKQTANAGKYTGTQNNRMPDSKPINRHGKSVKMFNKADSRNYSAGYRLSI